MQLWNFMTVKCMENLLHLTVHKMVKVDIALNLRNVECKLHGHKIRQDFSIQAIPPQNQCIKEEGMLLGVLQLISTTTSSLTFILELERVKNKELSAWVRQVITMFNPNCSETPSSTMSHQMP